MKRWLPTEVVESVRHNSRAAGFTIVETMVVLAVTGALFVAIAATLSGRQNEAQFMRAIQTVQSQLQQTIDQVAAGFFPTTNLSCSVGGATLTFSSGGGSQGANAPCVFLGKVVQFDVQATNPEEYRIYTIAGERGPGNGVNSPFSQVTPTVVGVSGDYTTYSVSRALQYGLTTAWARVVNGGTIGSVGFLMEPGSFATGGGYNSGSQPVDLVPIPGTNAGTSGGQTVSQAVSLINGDSTSGLRDNNLTADAPLNPPDGVQICFASGGTNQSGLITIGGSGRQLTVKLDIRSNKTCA